VVLRQTRVSSATLEDFASLPHTSKLNQSYRKSEDILVPNLLKELQLTREEYQNIQNRTRNLIDDLRTENKKDLVDQVIQGFPLTKKEGVLLMTLAEAMLRTPDQSTRENLLRDKLSQAQFQNYLNDPSSLLMNVAIRGFAIGSEVVKNQFHPPVMSKIAESTVPIMEKVADRAMRFMAKKFVVGTNINDAISKSLKTSKKGYTHSFDMLGEAAVTDADAERYFKEYLTAIHAIAESDGGYGKFYGDSISVKLSALHPRYSFSHEDRVIAELGDRLFLLCKAAAEANIPLTLDAEETERLEISLKLLSLMAHHPELKGWDGLGLAVQAYQKRASDVVDFLVDLAQSSNTFLNVRLVKGAYWDSEIKRCQELGFEDYPVFTRKETTDISYLVCAKKLLSHPDKIFPQFATHNALTIMSIMEMAKNNHSLYEFQKLHGMGDELYDKIIKPGENHPNCRIYAPVGEEKELLPYLVRRLLENGANNSFVNNLMDPSFPVEDLLQFPHEKLLKFKSLMHSKIPLPKDLYGSDRENSPGIDLDSSADVNKLLGEVKQFKKWKAFPLTKSAKEFGNSREIRNPASIDEVVGDVIEASPKVIESTISLAEESFEQWNSLPAESRSQCLRDAADLILEHQSELIALCVKEAGKSLTDAVAEIREAVDFCRYYAQQGEILFGSPIPLPGPTGEKNELHLEGRGIFVCISPWNFPLAIYVGQIAAALMAGNSVIAKPAEQTPLIAFRMCELFHEAGIPQGVLHLLPGSGDLGQKILEDERVTGVAFTGSTETARIINRTLAARDCAIATLIAETGGQNAMIVDSSALAEQVVADVISSAFQSAGQRCSALRLLLLQEEIAPRVLDLLKGAMAELEMGDPLQLSTDVGPVIDAQAQAKLKAYQTEMKEHATLLYECEIDETMLRNGYFVPPTAFEIPSVELLTNEVFGPILHVMRFKIDELDDVMGKIKSLKFGLCFGLHSRLDDRMSRIAKKIPAGNVYINRNTIGAVVGAQPFGGQGLSGTGPKAGGPHYLHRFATEKCVSRNITAQGGNTSLMTLQEDEEM